MPRSPALAALLLGCLGRARGGFDGGSDEGAVACEQEDCWPPGMLAHLQGHPNPYAGCLLFVCMSLPAVLAISCGYARRLFSHYAASPTPLVRYTICMALAPLVFTLAKTLAVVAPRWWRWVFLLAAGYESAVLVGFLRLASAYLGAGPGEELQRLAAAGPTRVWAVPLFFWAWMLCYPCMAKRTIQRQDLFLVQVLVLMRVVLAPVLAAADLLGSPLTGSRGSRRLAQLEAVSQLVAFYGLGVLLRATERARGGRLQPKLLVVMSVLIANTALFRLLASGCLTLPKSMDPAACKLAAGGCYTAADVAAAQSAASTCVVLVLLALYLRQAFPAREVASRKPVPGVRPSPGFFSGVGGADEDEAFPRESLEGARCGGEGAGVGPLEEEEEEAAVEGVE